MKKKVSHCCGRRRCDLATGRQATDALGLKIRGANIEYHRLSVNATQSKLIRSSTNPVLVYLKTSTNQKYLVDDDFYINEL